MIFTKDRISSIVLSMIITAGVFAPWWWATWVSYGLTWVSTGFFSAYSFLASIIVLQNSKKTVIYAAAVANSRSDKSFGIFGTLLTAAPIVLISISWIVTSNLFIGAFFPLSWLAFWTITNKAEDLFYKLPEKDQNKLIRLIQKKSSS